MRSVDLQRKPGEMISVNRHLLKYGRSAQSNLKRTRGENHSRETIKGSLPENLMVKQQKRSYLVVSGNYHDARNDVPQGFPPKSNDRCAHTEPCGSRSSFGPRP
jgi:hypothetical protein